MKRCLSLLLVVPMALFAACSSKGGSDGSTGTPTDPNAPAATNDPSKGSSGAPGSSGTPTATPTELQKNPIDGIAAAKVILDAGEYTDGPIWSAKEGVFYFTTPLGQSGLYRLKTDGTASKVYDGDPTTGAQPIGNTVDKSGNLFTVEAKRITKQAAAADAGAPTPVATGYDDSEAGVSPFDTLNDAVVSSSMNIYVTDPGYYDTAPVSNHLYRITPAGKVTVVDSFDDVPRPNGIALSPDGKSLYVGFTQPIQGTKPFVSKYAVNADGSLGTHTDFTDLDMDSQPDGIEVDQAGNVYVAIKGGIAVFKADGTKIGLVPIAEQPTAMAFGGADLKTLYVTTQGTKIWQLTVNVPGLVQ